MDSELLRQRLAAEQNDGDSKALYRFRLAAVRSGVQPAHLAGDQVKVDDNKKGVVVRVEELVEGPEQVHVRLNEKKVEGFDAGQVKVVVPHRPAVLLGEAELAQRLEEVQADPHAPRSYETLGEVARRGLREGIAAAVELFPYVDEAPDSDLRTLLTKIMRSRAFGEVEVALLKRKTDEKEADLIELPALAASAPSPGEANDVLNRLESMEPEQAQRVVLRSGKCLVGTGGPGFVDAEVRERAAALGREHADHDVRTALFVHAVTALQSPDLLEKALGSKTPDVRAAAALEFVRRKQTGSLWDYVKGEKDAGTLRKVAASYVDVLPLDVLAHMLEVGKSDADLEQQALLRLAESSEDGGRELLSPWLDKKRKTGVAAAIWCAGMLGNPDDGDRILKLLTEAEGPGRVSTSIEALARLGHSSAREALDTWGVNMVRAGSWGAEIADTVALLLGEPVDARELLGRFVINRPAGPVRLARGMESARALVMGGEPARAQVAKQLLPCRFPRFAEAVAALS